jgi:hypothetical protein
LLACFEILADTAARAVWLAINSEQGGWCKSRVLSTCSLTECPIETSERVKATDVAWVSHERRASRPKDPMYLVAPEICVEIESSSNPEGEWEERRRLLFERGAKEFWLCDLEGRLRFYEPAGPIARSGVCPDFPERISLD